MKNTALTSLIVWLLVALALIGGYVVWYGSVESLKKEAAALSLAIAVKTGEHSRTSETRNTLEALSEDETALHAHLVPTTGIVTFLEELEAIGSGFGADVAVVSVSDVAPDGRIALSLSVAGSFDAVMRTIGLIEYGPYVTSTKTLSLDAADDGTWSAALSVDVLSSSTP